METEIDDIEASKEILVPLKQVTPVSKYLALLLFIMMPFIGGFIGYTYAPEKVVMVENVLFKDRINPSDEESNLNQVVTINEVEDYSSSTESKLTEMPICDTAELFHFTGDIDTQGWISSTMQSNTFFKTIYPATFSLEWIGHDKYILRDSVTGKEIEIEVSGFEHSFSFGGDRYSSKFTYEPYSNTFWGGGLPSIYPKQCSPRADNYLSDRGFVFLSNNYNSSLLTYNIILKPTIEEYEDYDCNRPVSISISIDYETDEDGSILDQSTYDKFRTIIQTMIKNMQIRPVCVG